MTGVAWEGLLALTGIALAALLAAVPIVRRLRLHDDGVAAKAHLDETAHAPADLSPALAATLLDGQAARRAGVDPLVDMAGRGLLRFEPEPRRLLRPPRIAIRVADESHEPRYDLARPERALFGHLRSEARWHAGRLGPAETAKLAPAFARLAAELEGHAERREWLRPRPQTAKRRGLLIGAAELTTGVVLVALGLGGGSAGLVVAGAAFGCAGLLSAGLDSTAARRMPLGEALRLRLLGDRSALERALARGSSLAGLSAETLPWLRPTEPLAAWAVALGLDRALAEMARRARSRNLAHPEGLAWLTDAMPVSFPDAAVAGDRPSRGTEAGLRGIRWRVTVEAEALALLRAIDATLPPMPGRGWIEETPEEDSWSEQPPVPGTFASSSDWHEGPTVR